MLELVKEIALIGFWIVAGIVFWGLVCGAIGHVYKIWKEMTEPPQKDWLG